MQILKQEVKEQIRHAAITEFLTYGYENSSMRRIAKSAWMTVGNLYRYFQDKDHLFKDIVQPAYQIIERLIKEHRQDETEHDVLSFDLDQLETLMEPMAEELTKQREAFLIIIDGSKGSKYEGIKEKWIETMTTHIREDHLDQLVPANQKRQYRYIARVMSVSFFEGFFEILRCHPTRRKQRNSIKRHIKRFLSSYAKMFI